MFQTKFVQKIETHILCSKSCHVCDIVGKYCRAWGQDDSRVHVHFMLDTSGYKNTLRICNIYCLSITIVVAWTNLNVTLYVVHCLSCQI